jgi:hypothetical protein
LNYKESFSAVAATPILSPFAKQADTPTASSRNVNISYLLPINSLAGLVISWSANNIVLLDINQLCVHSWHCDLSDIQHVCICGTSVYILHHTYAPSTSTGSPAIGTTGSSAAIKRPAASATNKDNKPDGSVAMTATAVVSRIDLLSPSDFFSALISDLTAAKSTATATATSAAPMADEDKWRYCATIAHKYQFCSLDKAQDLRTVAHNLAHLPQHDADVQALRELIERVEAEEERIRQEAAQKLEEQRQLELRIAEEARAREEAERLEREQVERQRLDEEAAAKAKLLEERRLVAEQEARLENERRAKRAQEEREKRERKERERQLKLQKEAAAREKRAGLHVTDERDNVTLALLQQHAPPSPPPNSTLTAAQDQSKQPTQSPPPSSSPPSPSRATFSSALSSSPPSDSSSIATADTENIVQYSSPLRDEALAGLDSMTADENLVAAAASIPAAIDTTHTSTTDSPVESGVDVVQKKTRKKKVGKKTRMAMIAPGAIASRPLR